jgi:hypothetical protein
VVLVRDLWVSAPGGTAWIGYWMVAATLACVALNIWPIRGHLLGCPGMSTRQRTLVRTGWCAAGGVGLVLTWFLVAHHGSWGLDLVRAYALACLCAVVVLQRAVVTNCR